MKMKLFSLMASIFILIMNVNSYAAVKDTKHNLSVSGPGNIKASQESEICIFCHTPHNSTPNSPLWNRSQPGQSYTPYSSSTAQASPGQPTGASILCLSCHDGTIALGKVLSRQNDISMQGGVTTIPTGTGRLGTDLSDDHPVSFNYSSALQGNGELVSPGSLNGAVKLDSNGQLQCTSCHNAHDNSNGKFLVLDNQGGQLCETCHTKYGWNQTPHNLSSRTWNGQSPDPWPDTSWNNVRDNACQNCHKPHSAGSNERLLKSDVEEDNCLACHNGHVANEDIMAEFNKSTYHPIDMRTGTHDPNESAVVNSRHVECVDCHNPHAARASGTPAGPLTGVRGVNRFNSEVDPIAYEYELCFRCHGDSNGKPTAPTQRVFTNTNVRQEFNNYTSYHPVVRSGMNDNVPSLINGLDVNSIIKCTDCHNNNEGPGAGNNGPNGPHGSDFPHLLERQYLTQDPTTESTTAYAMCYKCHSRTSILGNDTFSRHNFHITGAGAMMGGGGMGGNLSTPCNVCHDPHASNFEKLINFDTNVVGRSSSNRREFNSTGNNAGECYLSCHGQNHDPCTYGPGGIGGTCGMMGGGGGGGGMH